MGSKKVRVESKSVLVMMVRTDVFYVPSFIYWTALCKGIRFWRRRYSTMMIGEDGDVARIDMCRNRIVIEMRRMANALQL